MTRTSGDRVLSRLATDEEEALLQQWEEDMEVDLILDEDVPFSGIPSSPIQEAEDFDINDAVSHWKQAEAQVSAVEEAELVFGLEENKLQELEELANSENINRHLMMKFLTDGSRYLVDQKAAEEADSVVLVSVHEAAEALLGLVNQIMNVKMDKRALEDFRVTRILQQQVDEHVQLKAEVHKLQTEVQNLKNEQELLNKELEQEKDRSICKICFTRPRDTLLLPCMHFQYCYSCLDKSRKLHSRCPTCRTPISGLLKHSNTD